MAHGHSQGTTGQHGGHRHGGTSGKPKSHRHSSVNYAYATDPLYGMDINEEMIGAWEVPPKMVTDGHIHDDGLSGEHIQDNTLPPDAFDLTPPAAPTDLALSSDVVVGSAGEEVVRIRVSLTHAADTDLYGVWVELTSTVDAGDPDFDEPSIYFIGRETSVLYILGVAGNTEYYARARSVDIQGNLSSYTSEVSVTTSRDSTAPNVPTGVVATAGFRGVLLRWNLNAAADLRRYRVRYAVDDGTGLAPDTDVWVDLMTDTNILWISGLTPDILYWFEVAAEDRSGNLSDYSADTLGVTSATPTQIGATDIAANTISSSMIHTDGLDANVIKTGFLGIEAGLSGRVDGIRVTDQGASTADKKVGQWDEDGIRIYSSSDQADRIEITDAELVVYQDNVPITAITPEGIDASALRFGVIPGGHNVIPNSSFEVGPYTSDSSVVNSGFTNVANTNVTSTGGALTITTLP